MNKDDSKNDGRNDDATREADDDELVRAARRLEKGIAPARDLWPGIAEAIRTPAGADPVRAGRGWQRYLAYAAAVVLLVGGSSGVTWLVMDEAQPVYVADAEQRAEPLKLQPVSGNFGGTHELGPEFMAARESLAVQLDSKLDQLSPQARAEVEKNIAEIRASIQQINRVLADEPDNALLQELLLAAYRDELYMMRRVDGLISTVMRREDI
jgi:hypothetical protein